MYIVLLNQYTRGIPSTFGWMVGCFGLNGPLRQYFSLYHRAVSQREGERKILGERKMSKQPPPAPTAGAVGPCPAIIQKFIQHHRTTDHPQVHLEKSYVYLCTYIVGVRRFRIFGGKV